MNIVLTEKDPQKILNLLVEEFLRQAKHHTAEQERYTTKRDKSQCATRASTLMFVAHFIKSIVVSEEKV